MKTALYNLYKIMQNSISEQKLLDFFSYRHCILLNYCRKLSVTIVL